MYLLRESAKVNKEIKDRKMYKIHKRLGAEEYKDDEMQPVGGAGEKRMKNMEGKGVSMGV